jgi:membrane protein DedA with SNARE-associated domain
VSTSGEALAYVGLFVVMAASGAGIPMIGTVALGTAAVIASQHTLSINTVILVACAGATVGGILGYAGGRRWGVALMERPGRWQAQRKRTLDKGHEIYRRWGWLACFVIPSFVAGIARMSFIVFLIFGTIAAIAHQFATAVPAYGAGKVASGHTDTVSILELASVVVLIGLIVWRVQVWRHRSGNEHGGAGETTAVG